MRVREKNQCTGQEEIEKNNGGDKEDERVASRQADGVLVATRTRLPHPVRLLRALR